MEVCKFFCTNDGVTVWGWGGYAVVIIPVMGVLIFLFLAGKLDDDDPETLIVFSFVLWVIAAGLTLVIIFFPWWTLGTIAFITLCVGVYQLGKRVGRNR